MEKYNKPLSTELLMSGILWYKEALLLTAEIFFDGFIYGYKKTLSDVHANLFRHIL